jgi:lipid II:glycine glycyltransferase (peptidoglycan interpeptide bridge formation enzyme)
MADGRRFLLPLVERLGIAAPLHIEASMPPAWGMGGLIGATPRAGDIAAVFNDLRSIRSARIHLRPNPLHADVWKEAAPPDVIVIPRRAHVLDLTGGYDTVWNDRFKSDTRRRVRKALKSGLRVELDTTGRLVPTFYELLERSFDRWGQRQHEPAALARFRGRRRDPIAKFHTIADILGERFRLWVATLDDQPVAALIVLQGRNAHYTRGAMDEDLAGPTNANYLLQQLAIEDACTAGCPTYHMGESGTSRGLAQFKSRFGAQPMDYAEYRLERLPLTRMDAAARGLVKRMIGFRDA